MPHLLLRVLLRSKVPLMMPFLMRPWVITQASAIADTASRTIFSPWVSISKSIVTDVTSRDMHLNTGALSTKHLLPVLTAYGYADVALALAHQTTFPSWGFWIENGATTTVS